MALSLGACPKHSGGPGVRHANDVMLSRVGTPNVGDQVYRCPSRTGGDGTIKLSYRNGKKRVAGRCKGGLMVGKWKAWYNNGALVWKARFDDTGRITGVFKSWYANDAKKAEVDFKGQGGQHGKHVTWWDNGKVRERGEYAGGKKVGCWRTWHKNGQKASKGTYANGRKVLTWLYWSPSGQKRKEKLGGEASHGKCLITF